MCGNYELNRDLDVLNAYRAQPEHRMLIGMELSSRKRSPKNSKEIQKLLNASVRYLLDQRFSSEDTTNHGDISKIIALLPSVFLVWEFTL